jgi:secreted PhoX family phosphatase
VNRRAFLTVAAGVPLLIAAAPGAGSPYGELLAPDANGIMLPPGFTAREIARAGQVVSGTKYAWHQWPDGGATFARPDSSWIYVSNSEVDGGAGGVGAIRFAPDGAITDAYSICSGTSHNCAGGVTPWRTWLTCEEVGAGRVWECDPEGSQRAIARPAMGSFAHEAVAADPATRTLFLTEDDPNGRLYRFTPAQWGLLDSGTLEVAQTADDGAVTWIPAGATGATTYAGGEGIAYYDGAVVFTTKSDGRIRSYDTRAAQVRVLYEPGQQPDIVGPDNITFSTNGDLYVCEDVPNDQDLLLFGADGARTQVLRLDASHTGSELTGVAFDPSGSRMYISSQRGGGGNGVTYEISGPFRTLIASATTSTSASASTAPGTTGVAPGRPDDTGGAKGDGSSVLPVAGAVGGAAVLALGGLAWLRTRRGTNPA